VTRDRGVYAFASIGLLSAGGATVADAAGDPLPAFAASLSLIFSGFFAAVYIERGRSQ
jgi:hypothetical protein